jgi:hypothetical protein
VTLDDIRTLLAAPAAWSEILLRTSSEGCKCSQCGTIHAAIAAFCDERARNLAQLLECDAEADRARDAAVRALLAAAEHCTQESDEHQREYAAAIAAVRAHYPEGE